MTGEQYEAIQDAFFKARRTVRETCVIALTPEELKAAYDADDAAVAAFHAALSAARADITIQS